MRIPNETTMAFEGFKAQFLADVLRIWDCNAQAWSDAVACVFRFENSDLLAWNDNGTIRATEQTVDTSLVDQDILQKVGREEDPRACLCWLPYPCCSRLIGRRKLAHELLQAFM